MKKLPQIISIVFFTAIFFLAPGLKAQVPQNMSYQAIVRDGANSLIQNSEVGIKISLIQGSETGPVVYSEYFDPNPTTNENGLVTVEIGGG